MQTAQIWPLALRRFKQAKMVRMRILPHPMQNPLQGLLAIQKAVLSTAHRIVPPRHSQRSLFRTRPVMIPLLLPPSTFHPSYGSSWQFFSSAEPIAAIAVVLHARHEQKEEEERILRRQKRLARLEASGISQEEFDLMLERKRSSYTTTKKGKRTLSRKRK